MKSNENSIKRMSAFAVKLMKNKQNKKAEANQDKSTSTYVSHDVLDNTQHNLSLLSTMSTASALNSSKVYKKKMKSDMKKIAKKQGPLGRASCLPDHALNSPMVNTIQTLKKAKKGKTKILPDIQEDNRTKTPALSFGSDINLLKEIADELNAKKFKAQKRNTRKSPLTGSLDVPAKKRKVSNDDKSEDGDRDDAEDERDNERPYMYDSRHEATKIFRCLIHPVKPAKFFSNLWEKKPMLVKRHQANYNEGWFSTDELDKILRKENVKFGVNLDVTTYRDGKRETHNPAGRAYAPVVWDFYQTGCSIRLLNPQTYSRNVWKFLSELQEYFGSSVGANIYLTPPGSQGFAPHYDDIEAFVVQLEGKKHWRLYAPRSDAETLPRYSSGNFSPNEIGEPILDMVLEAGDMLYFPRGTIHQADTPEDTHSLHITVSTYQKNTWGDLMEKLLPRTIQMAIEEDMEFRQALPRDYLQYMGIANQDVESPERTAFLRKVEQLMMKLVSHAPLDAACDQMGKDLIHDSLPPFLSQEEKDCSIHGAGEMWNKKRQTISHSVEFEPDTQVKLVRKGVIRLVTEDDKVHVYHSLENARIYHGEDMQYIEITADAAPAVEYLLHAYPEYTKVDDLPLDKMTQRMEIAVILYDKGLLITSQPLEPIDGSSSEGEEG